MVHQLLDKYKSNLHKKETLPRNLQYQLSKYRLPNTMFNDLLTGSQAVTLTKHISEEEINNVVKEYNEKITDILKINKDTYLKQINNDIITEPTMIPNAVDEAYNRLFKSNNTHYLSLFKQQIIDETTQWLKNELQIEYAKLDADFAFKNNNPTNKRELTTPNTNNNSTTNPHVKQKFTHYNVTPNNDYNSINTRHNSSKNNKDYDHFDRHIQQGITKKNKYTTPKVCNTLTPLSNDIYQSPHFNTSITPANLYPTFIRSIEQSSPSTKGTEYTPLPSWTLPRKRKKRIPRKRKKIGPRNSITQLYNHLNKINKLPSIINDISNKGIHNYSKKSLTVAEIGLLSLGLKFIIRPPPSTLNELKQSYYNFIRLLRIKNQMLGSNDFVPSDNTFRVPNKNFTPSIGGKALENYITNVNDNLLAAYDSLPLAIKRNQKIPKMFKVTIQKLKVTQQFKYAVQIKIWVYVLSIEIGTKMKHFDN